MSTTGFVIVTFVDEDDAPGIVASKWIKPDRNTCYYPSVCTEKMKDKLVRKMTEPDDTWRQHRIKILKGYKTYTEARLHFKILEETCDLDSDDVKERKRKITRVYLSDNSNSSDDCPTLKAKRLQPNLTYPASRSKPPSSEDSNSLDSPRSKSPLLEDSNWCDQSHITKINNDQPGSTNASPPRPTSSAARKNACPEEAKGITEAPDNLANSTFKIVQNQNVNCPSDWILNQQFAIHQSTLIQVVSDLSNKMDDLHRKVDLLLVQSGGSLNQQVEDALTVPDFMTSLPVKDDASFCHFNDQLKNSQNRNVIIKFLACMGGRNVRSLTTNMLRRILLDEVAELYSLTGKQMKNSHKKSFLTTETCQIIFHICKKIYDDVTEDKLKEITSDWLNQAKVRIMRRAEREKKALDHRSE